MAAFVETLNTNMGYTFGPDWKEKVCYYGGREGRHFNYLARARQTGDPALPDETTTCLCGHTIREQTFVVHRETRKIAVLGSCCIKRFIPNAGRTCATCGDAHQSRIDNFCAPCRLVDYRARSRALIARILAWVDNGEDNHGRVWPWSIANSMRYQVDLRARGLSKKQYALLEKIVTERNVPELGA